MARFTAESLAASFPLPPPFSTPPTSNTTTSARSSSTASNAPDDPRVECLTRTFSDQRGCALFRVDEQQTASEYNLITLPGGHDVVDVYPVTLSLFWCVSFDSCDPQKKRRYTVCDCDDVEHPVLVQELCSSDHGWMAAEGGFLFGVGSNRIEVLEPTSGGVVLAIKFPGFSCLDLMSIPFPVACPLKNHNQNHEYLLMSIKKTVTSVNHNTGSGWRLEF
ncbi:hypothetical protein Pelo_18979 [Pelomyxa schiedti]|nr:hypothetical protein Pelo_18979 [Pelomyxa schiedti]